MNNVHRSNEDTFMGIWVLNAIVVVHNVQAALKATGSGHSSMLNLRYHTCMDGIDLLCKYRLESSNSYSVRIEHFSEL